MDRRVTSAPLLEFYQREQNRLRKYVDSRTADDIEADDVIQDVMERMLSRPVPELPWERLAAYVYRSLKNRIIDIYRSGKNDLSLDRQVDGAENAGETLKDLIQDIRYDSAAILEKEESRSLIFQAIDELRAEEKAVVVATESDNIAFRELSELWDIPLGTLLARKSRALKKLRKTLSSYILEE